MSLIIATGTNLGDKLLNLQEGKELLSKHFNFIAESRVYSSPAVDYEAQPDFYNQVLEFQTPTHLSPKECMKLILDLEKQLGRKRDVLRGPRTIDIDILFFDLETSDDEDILIPHPRLFDRSFVVKPLRELPYFKVLEKNYQFKTQFDNQAEPI